MTTMLFISPLALTAMISLWLGFKLRLILFGAWISTCLAVAIWLMMAAFGDGAASRSGLNVLLILGVFQIAAFCFGLLLARARAARNAK